MDDYVRVVLSDELPVAIRGLTCKLSDGSYCVVINAKLSFEMQTAAYKHEIAHIHNNDCDKEINVNMLERIRHL